MGRATVLYLNFEDEGGNVFNKANLMQLIMDGPTIKWKLFQNLQVNMEYDTGRKMVNVGLCSLHTVHGVFRDGAAASGWDIYAFLSSVYYLFKDTPARREDYTKRTCQRHFH